MKYGNKYLEASFDIPHFKAKAKDIATSTGEILILSVAVKMAETQQNKTKSMW